jgi:hypothetical protein
MADIWQFKAVKPRQLRSARVRANILNALKDEGNYAVSLLNQTIATWEGKPKMEALIGYKGGDVSMIAGPTGDEHNVRKWHLLDDGTKIRYAVMSRNWQSKTRPGRLQAGAGRGRVVARGRKYPMPGIVARGWTPIINRMMKKGFKRKIQEAVTNGIRQ